MMLGGNSNYEGTTFYVSPIKGEAVFKAVNGKTKEKTTDVGLTGIPNRIWVKENNFGEEVVTVELLNVDQKPERYWLQLKLDYWWTRSIINSILGAWDKKTDMDRMTLSIVKANEEKGYKHPSVFVRLNDDLCKWKLELPKAKEVEFKGKVQYDDTEANDIVRKAVEALDTRDKGAVNYEPAKATGGDETDDLPF